MDIKITIKKSSRDKESEDFCNIVSQMYFKFFKRYTNDIEISFNSYVMNILNLDRSVFHPIFKEVGIHRLVRVSPFDSEKRRFTSFVSVEIDELDYAFHKNHSSDKLIRSYILDPYKKVQNHFSDFETSEVENILEGGLCFNRMTNIDVENERWGNNEAINIIRNAAIERKPVYVYFKNGSTERGFIASYTDPFLIRGKLNLDRFGNIPYTHIDKISYVIESDSFLKKDSFGNYLLGMINVVELESNSKNIYLSEKFKIIKEEISSLYEKIHLLKQKEELNNKMLESLGCKDAIEGLDKIKELNKSAINKKNIFESFELFKEEIVEDLKRKFNDFIDKENS